jgi:hypothetical protein
LSSIGVDHIGPGIRALAVAVLALAQARGVPRVLVHLH